MGYLASLLFIFIPPTSRWNSVFSYVGIVDAIKRRRRSSQPAPSLLGFLSIADFRWVFSLLFIHSFPCPSMLLFIRLLSFIHAFSVPLFTNRRCHRTFLALLSVRVLIARSISLLFVTGFRRFFISSFSHSFIHFTVHPVFPSFDFIRSFPEYSVPGYKKSVLSCKKQNY